MSRELHMLRSVQQRMAESLQAGGSQALSKASEVEIVGEEVAVRGQTESAVDSLAPELQGG